MIFSEEVIGISNEYKLKRIGAKTEHCGRPFLKFSTYYSNYQQTQGINEMI